MGAWDRRRQTFTGTSRSDLAGYGPLLISREQVEHSCAYRSPTPPPKYLIQHCNGTESMSAIYSAPQSQNAVSAYLQMNRILPFGIAPQYRVLHPGRLTDPATQEVMYHIVSLGFFSCAIASNWCGWHLIASFNNVDTSDVLNSVVHKIISIEALLYNKTFLLIIFSLSKH